MRKEKIKMMDYIKNHTTRRSGVAIYKCDISGLIFGWEDRQMHLDYLTKNNLI